MGSTRDGIGDEETLAGDPPPRGRPSRPVIAGYELGPKIGAGGIVRTLVIACLGRGVAIALELRKLVEHRT